MSINETKYFYTLTPDRVDQTCQNHGFKTTGRQLALNSLENRVYDVELMDSNVIVKFYRPGRWDWATILEEHSFLLELSEQEIPVIPPIVLEGEQTLFQCPNTQIYYAFFPKIRGRLKDELNEDELLTIGRLIARIHNSGRLKPFQHRIALSPQDYIAQDIEFLQTCHHLPQPTLKYYLQIAEQFYDIASAYFNDVIHPNMATLRIHGDIHRGNILWTTQDGPFIVDLDDCMNGPAVQDLWQIASGRDRYAISDRNLLLEGYHEFAKQEVLLTPQTIEILRTMRMIHFNGWIARRYQDPSFMHAFPHFETPLYWESALLDLKEQWSYSQAY